MHTKETVHVLVSCLFYGASFCFVENHFGSKTYFCVSMLGIYFKKTTNKQQVFSTFYWQLFSSSTSGLSCPNFIPDTS